MATKMWTLRLTFSISCYLFLTLLWRKRRIKFCHYVLVTKKSITYNYLKSLIKSDVKCESDSFTKGSVNCRVISIGRLGVFLLAEFHESSWTLLAVKLESWNSTVPYSFCNFWNMQRCKPFFSISCNSLLLSLVRQSSKCYIKYRINI